MEDMEGRTPLEITCLSEWIKEESDCNEITAKLIKETLKFQMDLFLRLLKIIDTKNMVIIFEIITTLIKKRIKPEKVLINMINFYDQDSKLTPLKLAIEKDYPKIVKILIDAGAKFDLPNGEIYISIVANSCSVDVLKVLNEYSKFNLFATTRQDQNALHIAAQSKSDFKLEFLKQFFQLAEKKSSDKLLKLIMHKDDTLDKNCPIIYFIETESYLLVELLLKICPKQLYEKLDRNENCLIHLIARKGSIQLLEILSKNKYFKVLNKKNAETQTALHIATANKHPSGFILNLIEILKSSKTDLYINDNDCNKMTPLNYVIRNNDIECFKKLIELLYDIIKKDTIDKLLLYSAEIGSIEILKFLIETYALHDKYSNLARVAFENGQFKVLKALFQIKKDRIDLLYNDMEGNNLFHICARQNNLAGFRFLVTNFKKFEDVRSITDCLVQENAFEETILHISTKHRHFEFIQEILETSFDLVDSDFSTIDQFRNILVFAKDQNEETCLYIANDLFIQTQKEIEIHKQNQKKNQNQKEKERVNDLLIQAEIEKEKCKEIANFLFFKYYDLDFKFEVYIFKKIKIILFFH